MSYLLPHLVDRAAESEPTRDAFRYLDQRVTYADLSERSNALAHLLVDESVGPGDRVGVFMPRCTESAVAVYGIMKAGAAFVPIDAGLPKAAIVRLLNDCGIRHLIADSQQQRSLESLTEDATTLECVIGPKCVQNSSIRTVPWMALTQYPSNCPPALTTTGQDLAYIMYTSGSTGRPKGIMHTHFSGMSYAKLSAETYQVGAGDRIGSHSPLHFDMATFGYFSAPFAAATTVLIPEAHTKFPASLSQLIEAEKITIWYSVPLALVQLLLRGVLQRRDLRSLRWIMFGGEPFPRKHLRALMAMWPHARFSNVYGPAEVNQCTYYHVPPNNDNTCSAQVDQQIPIGKVWENSRGVVVNEEDTVVETAGGEGELLIQSPTMMQGYWGQADLNATAFFRREVHPGFSQTFYRTGDLVRIQDDGNYLFLGRKDRQIKSHGYRIELDAVETVLVSHFGVEEAAAYPVRSADGDVRVHCAATLSGKQTTSSSELVQFLKRQLPWYAVPSQVDIRDSFPRTGTNKIDRRRLQLQAESGHLNSDSSIA